MFLQQIKCEILLTPEMWHILTKGVGSNMKENDVRISVWNQMPDSLAKGSLHDAWIAVHQRSSCIISAVNRQEQEQLGESDWVQAMTYEQEEKKGKIKHYYAFSL